MPCGTDGRAPYLPSLRHLIARAPSLAHIALLIRLFGSNVACCLDSRFRVEDCVCFEAVFARVIGKCGKVKEMAKGALVLVVAAVVILMTSVEKTEGAVACNDVTNELLACASFIVGTGPAPTAACCSGVQRLNSQAKTVADRQGVCGCLKSAASSYGVNFNKAAQLPSKCGVSLNVPISPTVDCSKVH